jgi:hypothetical protein
LLSNFSEERRAKDAKCYSLRRQAYKVSEPPTDLSLNFQDKGDWLAESEPSYWRFLGRSTNVPKFNMQ